jgi:hypothetical protein
MVLKASDGWTIHGSSVGDGLFEVMFQRLVEFLGTNLTATQWLCLMHELASFESLRRVSLAFLPTERLLAQSSTNSIALIASLHSLEPFTREQPSRRSLSQALGKSYYFLVFFRSVQHVVRCGEIVAPLLGCYLFLCHTGAGHRR